MRKRLSTLRLLEHFEVPAALASSPDPVADPSPPAPLPLRFEAPAASGASAEVIGPAPFKATNLLTSQAGDLAAIEIESKESPAPVRLNVEQAFKTLAASGMKFKQINDAILLASIEKHGTKTAAANALDMGLRTIGLHTKSFRRHAAPASATFGSEALGPMQPDVKQAIQTLISSGLNRRQMGDALIVSAVEHYKTNAATARALDIGQRTISLHLKKLRDEVDAPPPRTPPAVPAAIPA